MFLIALSLVATLLTSLVKLCAGLTVFKTVGLFLSLEGTVLLAWAIPPPDGMEEGPKGLFKRLIWQFKEGRRLNYPMRYNPVCFWLGLLFLAGSFVLSAFSF